jgi:hypothetical protein
MRFEALRAILHHQKKKLNHRVRKVKNITLIQIVKEKM